MHITVPSTMNGQIASGEVNRYRFEARKGQRLVVSVNARELIPYIADGVPGWFQPILTLCDAEGTELAYNDDFRFKPDPTLRFEVPKDGEYVLTINDALYRGREDFVYRITIGELPFVTSIFPLGARVGDTAGIEVEGWNLEKASLAPPPKNAEPGTHMIAATKGKVASNYVPFALGTLPECLDKEPNNDPSKAQKVKLPIIVNGRMDQPDDWDVFEVEGRTGETIVAEVHARRLDSPVDSFLKVTDASGKVLAFNDEHHDAASGLNTHHADSYLIVKLPADGKYFVHMGETTRKGGKEYGYRLRISPPRPDFELRVVPPNISIVGKSSAAVSVYALRKDGFDGPIKLSFKDLPEGLTSKPVTLAAKKHVTRLSVKTTLKSMDEPVSVTGLHDSGSLLGWLGLSPRSPRGTALMHWGIEDSAPATLPCFLPESCKAIRPIGVRIAPQIRAMPLTGVRVNSRAVGLVNLIGYERVRTRLAPPVASWTSTRSWASNLRGAVSCS